MLRSIAMSLKVYRRGTLLVLLRRFAAAPLVLAPAAARAGCVPADLRPSGRLCVAVRPAHGLHGATGRPVPPWRATVA